MTLLVAQHERRHRPVRSRAREADNVGCTGNALAADLDKQVTDLDASKLSGRSGVDMTHEDATAVRRAVVSAQLWRDGTISTLLSVRELP